jgi:hypothetical protein
MSPDQYLKNTIEINDFKDAEQFYTAVQKNFKVIRLYKPKENIWIVTLVLLSLGIGLAIANVVALIKYHHSIFYFEGDTMIESVKYILIASEVICFGICITALLKFDRHEKKFGKNKLAFCWLFNCIEQINFYLYNANISHLVKANIYFKEYLEVSEFNFEYYAKRTQSGGGESKVLEGKYIAYFLEEIKNKYEWIKFSDETFFIIDTLGKLDSKITVRITKGVEINEVVNILLRLMLFEKSKFRPPFQYLESKKLDYKKSYFDSYVGLLSKLPELIDKDFTLPLNVKGRFNKLLFSENIISNFLTWYLIFQIVLVVVIVPIIVIYQIRIDSTLIVGTTTTPFLVAAGLIGITYKKRG